MTQLPSTSIPQHGGSPSVQTGLRPLVISGEQWRLPVVFMLTLALCGLKFFPAVFFLIVLLVRAFRTDRYTFTVMLMLSLGCYGITDQATFVVKTFDMMLAASLTLFLLMHKTPLVRKLMWLCVAYGVALSAIAMFSIESYFIQILSIRNYVAICCFIIPVGIFAGEKFEMGKFFDALMPFALLMCGFYAIDAFIFKGNILVPRTFAWGADSSILHPLMNPFSLAIFRKYPPGMVFIAVAAYPILRYYQLNWKQWTVVILGLLATTTFTVILPFLLLYCIARGLGKYIFVSVGTFIGLFALAYFVDSMLPVYTTEDGQEQSTFRIKSSINQFVRLKSTTEVEELAKFGSGRMAQLIPNLQLVDEEGKELTGLGFLHEDYTKIARYEIVNVFFTDISKNTIQAGIVEINPAQIYIYAGIAGLIVVYGFYFCTYLMLRKLRYRGLYFCTLFLVLLMSLGNYATVSNISSIVSMGFTLGLVCLANRPEGKVRRKRGNFAWIS